MEIKKYVYERYPVVQKACVGVQSPTGNVYAMHMLQVANRGYFGTYAEKNWMQLPYLQAVQPYMQYAEESFPHMMILVSEQPEIAEKVAAVLACCRSWCRERDEMEEFGFEYPLSDYGDEEESETTGFLGEKTDGKSAAYACAYVNFQTVADEEERNTNLLGKLSVLSNTTTFFTGIPEGGTPEQPLDVIKACPSAWKLVHVSRKQSREPWVLLLQHEYNAAVLEIPDLRETYYEEVTADLLDVLDCRLAGTLSVDSLIRRVKQRAVLDEAVLAWILGQAAVHAQTSGEENELTKADFVTLGPWGEDALTRLQKMTGLSEIKQVAEEYGALAGEFARNKAIKNMHLHLIFGGNPGTGKTTLAKLFSEILAEHGVGNATFVVCSRKDLIGKYVGHTAPKVAKKFEEARGGVLFVDEAGFFLNREAGGFVEEAIREFVRFMELYTDVTVIFAMYAREVEDFLALDEGLASRIAQVVHFAGYTNEELWQILSQMLEEQGYKLSGICRKAFDSYMDSRRRRSDFGNAREARKLAEMCIRMIGLRHAQAKKPEAHADRMIRQMDMQAAIRRLATGGEEKKTVFGFAMPSQKGCGTYGNN